MVKIQITKLDGKMIEGIWIIIPNLIASYMVMVNKAFYANLIYCFGYLLFIWHNYNSGDSSQVIYFTILEIMSIIGVFLYIIINNSQYRILVISGVTFSYFGWSLYHHQKRGDLHPSIVIEYLLFILIGLVFLLLDPFAIF